MNSLCSFARRKINVPLWVAVVYVTNTVLLIFVSTLDLLRSS